MPFPRLAPLLVDAGIGVAVGFVRNDDLKHVATRTKMTKQMGFYVETGAVVLGLLGEMGNFIPRSLSEPLLEHGVAFTSERLTRNALSGTGINTPYPSQVAGYGAVAGRSYAAVSGMPAHAAAMSSVRGATTKIPTATVV